MGTLFICAALLLASGDIASSEAVEASHEDDDHQQGLVNVQEPQEPQESQEAQPAQQPQQPQAATQAWEQYIPEQYRNFGMGGNQSQGSPQQNWEQYVPEQYRKMADKQRKQDKELQEKKEAQKVQEESEAEGAEDGEATVASDEATDAPVINVAERSAAPEHEASAAPEKVAIVAPGKEAIAHASASDYGDSSSAKPTDAPEKKSGLWPFVVLRAVAKERLPIITAITFSSLLVTALISAKSCREVTTVRQPLLAD